MMVIRPSGGGAFGHVLKLSAAFAKRGHQVAVCGPHEARREDVVAVGAALYPVGIERPIAPISDARSLAGIASAYRDFKPDLIHGHGSKGPVLGKVARAVRPGTPFVFTPHQYAFANHFASPRQQRVYRVIERSVSRLADLVVCVCEAERELAVQIGPRDRTRVVYNGVEAGVAASGGSEFAALKERGPLVALVAELHPRKGLTTLLDAVPAVLASQPRATFVVAGEGESRAALERQAHAMGIAPSVRFLGHVPNVPDLLASADAYVNPAWAEAFPYAVLEAMAAGLPIVATDVGGTREAVEDGVTGRLVPAHDPVALAGAIEFLLADSARAAQLAAQATARVHERFTLSGMIEGTLEAYYELGIEDTDARPDR